MKKVNIHQIDAFTDKPFGGNPAAVVLSSSLSDKEMGLIAKEMNLSETAFLSSSDSADYKLRWFTPAMEVDLCGHATIASIHFLNEARKIKEDSPLTFETRSGILNCFTRNNRHYMQIPRIGMKRYNDDPEKLLQILGLKQEDADKDFMLLDNGYLYVPVKKIDVLGKIKPDFKALRNLSDISPVMAVTVYSMETLEEISSAHLRFFAPYYGIDEDPVTGSANGPLLNVLSETGRLIYNKGQELFFEQGDFIGRPGRIMVTVINDDIYIAGNAYTVLTGELTI